MNKSKGILLVIMLLFFAIHQGFSQNNLQVNDTLRTKSEKDGSGGDPKKQGDAENESRQTGSGEIYGQETVRQVKGVRPDMSKARGARPPMIVRPAGSSIPRGVGKPAGAGRYGGR